MSSRGGARVGAGRKSGSGPFGEPTKAVRLPESLVDKVLLYARQKVFSLPLYGSKVIAGFPSPADDYLEGSLDLNEYLIDNPSSTFLVRAAGDSMINIGIFENDVLVVDRSIEVKSGHIVIAVLNGELTVKRLIKSNNQWYLKPENDSYPDMPLNEDIETVIWGVVTNVLHKLI